MTEHTDGRTKNSDTPAAVQNLYSLALGEKTDE